MRKELTFSELDSEELALLPERETLWFNTHWANVMATNSSMALNAATLYSSAHSTATQYIQVSQYH